jgi:hypothetical protein
MQRVGLDFRPVLQQPIQDVDGRTRPPRSSEIPRPVPKLQPNQEVSAKSVAKTLKPYVGDPVMVGGRTLILKSGEDAHSKILTFFVLSK